MILLVTFIANANLFQDLYFLILLFSYNFFSAFLLYKLVYFHRSLNSCFGGPPFLASSCLYDYSFELSTKCFYFNFSILSIFNIVAATFFHSFLLYFKQSFFNCDKIYLYKIIYTKLNTVF